MRQSDQQCSHKNAEKSGSERNLGNGWQEQDYRCLDCGSVDSLRFRRTPARYVRDDPPGPPDTPRIPHRKVS